MHLLVEIIIICQVMTSGVMFKTNTALTPTDLGLETFVNVFNDFNAMTLTC